MGERAMRYTARGAVALPEASSATRHWSWTQRLKRVFALELATCPFCYQGRLRLFAAMTQGEVISKILRYVKLAPDPPPMAPARSRQAAVDWVV
jgi:hypothetical protein